MDKRGQALLGLLFSGLLVASGTVLAEPQPALRALAWLAPENRLEALGSEPTYGFRVNKEKAPQSDMVLAGEAVFRAPNLLGGQAAKAGISCASCHVNGRDNPHFQFPGVSDQPGTADVTHSFFSSHRGDRTFNPVVIPDLTQAGKISRTRDGELEKFVRDLIVEEFDGVEPDPMTLTALGTYIRALCETCSKERRAVTLQTHLYRVEQMLTLVGKIRGRAPKLTHLILSSTRHQLSLVHERYSDKRLKRERTALVSLSRDIAKLQRSIGDEQGRFHSLSEKASRKLMKTRGFLSKSENRSLYNHDRLKAWIASN